MEIRHSHFCLALFALISLISVFLYQSSLADEFELLIRDDATMFFAGFSLHSFAYSITRNVKFLTGNNLLAGILEGYILFGFMLLIALRIMFRIAKSKVSFKTLLCAYLIANNPTVLLLFKGGLDASFLYLWLYPCKWECKWITPHSIFVRFNNHIDFILYALTLINFVRVLCHISDKRKMETLFLVIVSLSPFALYVMYAYISSH